jgi:hypothetical protein
VQGFCFKTNCRRHHLNFTVLAILIPRKLLIFKTKREPADMTKKTWSLILILAILFTVLTIILNFFWGEETNLVSVGATLIRGLVLGLIIILGIQYSSKKALKKIVVETGDENIIKESLATHISGRKQVGGKLVLTNKRLIFKSHKFNNIETRQGEFDLQQIERLQVTKTLNILENGLAMQLINNETHQFAVQDANNWIEMIIKSKNSK